MNVKNFKQKLSNGSVRLLAGALISLLLVGIVALSTGHMDKGHSKEGLYYQVTGLRPDAEVMRINGEPITVEEYLYWVATDCNYLVNYGGITDLNGALTEELTYADYIQNDVLVTLRLYGAVRSWADQNGILLTEEQKAELTAQRDSYVEYYGSEEAYLQQLALLGISEECFDRINETPYFYSRMVEIYTDPDSAFYPGEETLKAFVSEQGLITALLAYYTVDKEADEESQSALAQRFAQCAEEAAAHPDKVKTLTDATSQISEVTVEPLTFLPTPGDPISDAASALAIGEVSPVVENGTARYIIVRQEPDLNMAAEEYVSRIVEEKRDNAVVVFNEELYNAIDIPTFYENLSAAQQSLAQGTISAP